MPAPRRAAVVAALLLAGSAACGSGGGTSQAGIRASAGAGAPEATTATTAAPPVAPGLTSTTAPGTSPTTGPRTTTTTSRPAGITTTAAAAVRALTPAAPGVYRYSTSGQTVVAGTTVVFPAVTTLAVDPPSGTRQRSTRDLRNAAGDGTATELSVDYRADGVYLAGLRITTGFGGSTDTRDLTPSSPVLLLATGARTGARLEYSLNAAGGTARLVVEVLGEERLAIAGQAVDTLVMRAVVTLPPGDVTGRQELTVNVDRRSSLWVRERSVADASAAGGMLTLRSEYRATLLRLTP